jgi:hypothetical protein
MCGRPESFVLAFREQMSGQKGPFKLLERGCPC